MSDDESDNDSQQMDDEIHISRRAEVHFAHLEDGDTRLFEEVTIYPNGWVECVTANYTIEYYPQRRINGVFTH